METTKETVEQSKDNKNIDDASLDSEESSTLKDDFLILLKSPKVCIS